jgi:uncharacterized protein (TIRG00374 family)
MSKRVGWTLRLVVAIAGVGFILWTLTWQDHVVLPAGYALPDQPALTEPATVPVVEQSGGQLVLNTSELAAADQPRYALRRDALGRAGDEPRFKPGVVTTVAGMDWALVLAGLAVMGVVFPIQTGRWLMLMRCRGMAVGFWRAFRLTMAGLFFNFCMPGTTGGDVIKAYYTAKNSGQRTTAVISVLLDRLTGMVGLVLLAAVVGLTLWRAEPWVGRITLGLWAGLIALVMLGLAYLATGWRRALRLDRLRDGLPGGQCLAKVDEAAAAYRHHKGAVVAAIGLSVLAHGGLMTTAALAGKALGVGHSFGLLLAVLPLVLLAGSVPISPQGIGVMEVLALALLFSPDQPELATANQIVGMLLLFRLCMLAYALLGSLVLLRGDIHLFPETQETSETAQTAGRNNGDADQPEHSLSTKAVHYSN